MIGGGIPINSKAKMMIAGALVVTGTLGTVTAFASTNNSNKSSTTVTGQAGPTVSHHGMSRGGCDSGRIGFRGALNPGSLATILGIDQQTLQSDLKVGQSLVQIAQSKNISEQALISDLQADYKKQLDAAVSSGKFTSAQEQKMLANFEDHVKQMVEHPDGPGHGGFRWGGPGRIGFRGALNPGSLATILGIDQQSLQSDLKAGQSLVQIAQSKNISEQALISDLQTNYKKQLDAAMSTGKLTSAQEQKMLTNFDNHVKQMVERTGSVFAEHYGSHFGHTTRSKTSSTTSSTTNTTGN